MAIGGVPLLDSILEKGKWHGCVTLLNHGYDDVNDLPSCLRHLLFTLCHHRQRPTSSPSPSTVSHPSSRSAVKPHLPCCASPWAQTHEPQDTTRPPTHLCIISRRQGLCNHPASTTPRFSLLPLPHSLLFIIVCGLQDPPPLHSPEPTVKQPLEKQGDVRPDWTTAQTLSSLPHSDTRTAAAAAAAPFPLPQAL